MSVTSHGGRISRLPRWTTNRSRGIIVVRREEIIRPIGRFVSTCVGLTHKLIVLRASIFISRVGVGMLTRAIRRNCR